MNLANEYQRLCRTPSDIYLHLPRFVALVEESQAQHVIELGTRTGVSTIAWLHALNSTGGRLTSIDIDERPDIGLHPHWTYIQGDDCDLAVVEKLDPADIVFIDTSHLYEHTVRELDLYRPLVKPGGLMVMHDTQLEHPMGAPPLPRFPVRTAFLEFVAAQGLEWREFTDCFGLGIAKVG